MAKLTHTGPLRSLFLITPFILIACKTTPLPPPPPVVIAPPPVKTCYNVAELQRVVIPAKTKTFVAITEIDNAPYEPIERRQEMVREIEAEQVFYAFEGKEVANICDPENIEPARPLNPDARPVDAS